jgi:hypothetical protein
VLIAWPGTLAGFLASPFGFLVVGDILKWIGVSVLPLYSSEAPSTLTPDTLIEVAPRFDLGPASLIAAVSTP